MTANTWLRSDGGFFPINASNVGISTSTTTGILTFITNSLGANVGVAATATTGPSVAQGSSGIWLAIASISVEDTGTIRSFSVTLTDGTSVLDSGIVSTPGAALFSTISLAGVISAPAGNIRITATVPTSGNAFMLSNGSGSSKDSTLTAIRIG